MKRIVALLLGMSMVLACAGCTKETEETKKKKKKKKTEDTESVTTEEPSDPTDTEPTDTEPTDTEPTDPDPTDPSPSVSHDIVYDHSLESLYVPYPTVTYYSYGEHRDTDDEFFNTGCMCSIDDLYISTGDYPELQNAIDDVIGPHQRTANDMYNDEVEKVVNGQSPDQDRFVFSTAVYREDSEVFSFQITDAEDFDVFEIESYNFRSKDGSVITLDDVVTDKDMFSTIVATMLEDYVDNSEFDEDDVVSYLLKGIEDSTVQFNLVYDGIWLFYNNEVCLKIPVIGNEAFFNMNYFCKTPEYYTLISDEEHLSFTWDINDDGTQDFISCEMETVDEEFVGPSITLNGKTLSAADVDVDYWAYGARFCFLMHTDDGYYFGVTTWSVDGIQDTYIYDVSGSEPVFVEFFSLSFEYPTFIDPDATVLSGWCDLIGTHFVDNEYSFMSNNGYPYALYTYYNCQNKLPLVVTKEFDAMMIDDQLNELGMVCIEEGTAVRCAHYKMEDGTLVLEVLFPDYKDNFLVTVWFEEIDWEFYVNDFPIDELFTGYMFWG